MPASHSTPSSTQPLDRPSLSPWESVSASDSARALQAAVQQVSGRERRLMILHGVANLLALGLTAAMLAGVVDFGLRIRDPGIRWGLTLLTFGLAAYWFWKHLLPVLTFRRDDVSTAQRIEACLPHFGDRLSTAMAFLSASRSETIAGSAQLRQSVVDRAHGELRQASLSSCLTPAPAVRALTRLALVALVALILLALAPGTVRLAAHRFLIPWGDNPWPRRHVLQFIDTPAYLGPGEDFEAHVVDAMGELPELVQLQLWFEGDAPSEMQTRVMRYAGGRMVHHMSNIQRSFRYRALGGDDDTMDWQSLTLVEPPGLESLEIEVTPPDYLGADPYKVTGLIRAVEGSTWTLRGLADRELAAVHLHVGEPDLLGAVSAEPPWQGVLESDARSFRFPAEGPAIFELVKSGTYWLELTDPEERTFKIAPGEIQVQVDSPPTIRLQSTSRDGVVTPEARLDLTIVAEDDFAISEIELQWNTSETSDSRLSIWTRPEPPAGVSLVPPPPADMQRITHEFDLQALELPPGTVVELVARASDFVPQSGSSTELRLRVVSREEFEQRLSQQQSELVTKIQEVVGLQQESKRQSESLRSELVDTGEITRSGLDRMQSAELNQRRIPQRIQEDHDSLLTRVQQTRAEIQRNRLDRPDDLQRLDWLSEQLGRLAEQTLPEIQREMLEAIKLTPSNLSSPQPYSARQDQALESAVAKQGESLEKLESIAQQLVEWESYRRFSREADQLWREQGRIQEQTESLHPLTVGREQRELPTAERAALRNLEMQQADLSRRFENFLERLTRKQESLADSEPEAAQNLASGSTVAREENLAGLLRDITGHLDQNQLGQALSDQQAAAEGLEDVSRALAGLPPRSMDRQPDQTSAEPSSPSEAEDEDEQSRKLRERFQRLLEKAGELEAQQESLAQESEKLWLEQEDDLEISPSRVAPLITEQRELRRETTSLQEIMEDSPLFAWQLERISNEMARATSLLEQQHLDRANPHQRRAVRRLRELREAAEPLATGEPSSADDDTSRPADSDDPDDAASEAQEVPDRPRLGLEDLRLLRSLQAEVLELTREAAERSDQEPSGNREDVGDSVLELAREQERLGRFLLDLLATDREFADGTDQDQEARPPRDRTEEQRRLDELDDQLFPN